MQVCNLTTYPHLMGFFRELGVDTEESDMSFALSTPDVEWGSRGLSAIFAQPGLWRSPKFLLMVWEVIAFGRQAPEVLLDPKRGAKDPPADDVHQKLAAARPALDREAVALDAELGGDVVAVEQLAAVLELRGVPQRQVAVDALRRVAVGSPFGHYL